MKLKILMTALFAAVWTKPEYTCVNDAGSHAGGCVTRFAETAITSRYLHVTPGTDASKQVVIGGATDEPSGIAYDEAAVDEEVAVQRFGSANATRKAVASKAIAAEVNLFTDAAGKVTDTAVNGSWLIGKSLTATAADGELIEFDPITPVEQSV